MKNEKEQLKAWYDSPSSIINLLILFTVIIIVLSQAFAVNNSLSAEEIFRSLLNHNILYLIGLIYFIPLKTKSGRKYFNYLNIFLIIIYFIFTVASILTMVQSFGITSLISFIINIIFLIYISHNLLKNTKIWKELKMSSSPFYEISNENYFYSIVITSVIMLAVNLIAATTFDGVVLSILSTIYNCLLARYIYLYQVHIENPDEADIFTEMDKSKELPKLKTMAKEVTNKKLNNYQILSLITFGICFVVGIIFGNIFPSCTTNGLFENTCTTTEFNFSLTVTIWFISLLVCVFFYGLGQIISLLESINRKLDKKK